MPLSIHRDQRLLFVYFPNGRLLSLHDVRSDTSIWWQTDEVETLGREGGTIDIRLTLDPAGRVLDIAENSPRCEARNLRLEPDEEWPTMRYVAIALSTGITPFLAYLRYMQAMDFGRSADRPGCHVTLIASVRHVVTKRGDRRNARIAQALAWIVSIAPPIERVSYDVHQ